MNLSKGITGTVAESKSASTNPLVNELQHEAEQILQQVRERFPHYRESLEGTTIRLSGRLTSSAGNACPKRKQIGLSIPIFSLKENREEYRNTVLHELAHIIAGPKVQSHGKEWRDIFIELGGNGKRTHQMRARGRHHRHMIQCEQCGTDIEVSTRMKNSIAKGRRDYIHIDCVGILVFREENSLEKVSASSEENPADDWFSQLSKKLQQGTLFRFFGSE